MAQRNVTEREIRYIVRYGSKSYAAKAEHFVLRRSDIPVFDRDQLDAHRLTNVVVTVVDGSVLTVYRNDKPFRHIGKKTNWWHHSGGESAA